MDSKHWYDEPYSDEAEGIYRLYGPDILHTLDSAILPRDGEPVIGRKVNLFRIAYPVIRQRSMGDGLAICTLLQKIHAQVNDHITHANRPCRQKWYLNQDGQIIIQILDEDNHAQGAPANPDSCEEKILSFLVSVENDVEKDKIRSEKTYRLNIISMAKSCPGNIDEGRFLIKLISMVSRRIDALLKNICADHPEIGGSQDWYVAGGGGVVMELYVCKK